MLKKINPVFSLFEINVLQERQGSLFHCFFSLWVKTTNSDLLHVDHGRGRAPERSHQPADDLRGTLQRAKQTGLLALIFRDDKQHEKEIFFFVFFFLMPLHRCKTSSIGLN